MSGLTDGRADILFDQMELLIGTSVSLSLHASGFNSNMIGLEAFGPAILFARRQFEKANFLIFKTENHLIQNEKEFDSKQFNYREFSSLSQTKNSFHQVNT